jgi:hypothetical protein
MIKEITVDFYHTLKVTETFLKGVRSCYLKPSAFLVVVVVQITSCFRYVEILSTLLHFDGVLLLLVFHIIHKCY